MDHGNEEKRITLRIPAALHADLSATAEAKFRSMNAEICHRLSGNAEVGAADIAEMKSALGILLDRSKPITMSFTLDRPTIGPFDPSTRKTV